MTQLTFQRAFAPFKRLLPEWLHRPIRAIATASLTPIVFSYRSGHFRSSMGGKPVRKDGEALPWYTYPSIEFLDNRSYSDKTVLEFGAGQSTLWWAKRAKHVLALEGDPIWYERIASGMPDNVDLQLVSMATAAECESEVRQVLSRYVTRYDVVVVDGLYRREMTTIAREAVADGGVIICDDAEGYGIHEAFLGTGFARVDFYGHAAGVILPHATSLFFKSGAFVFDAGHRISRV